MHTGSISICSHHSTGVASERKEKSALTGLRNRRPWTDQCCPNGVPAPKRGQQGLKLCLGGRGGGGGEGGGWFDAEAPLSHGCFGGGGVEAGGGGGGGG